MFYSLDWEWLIKLVFFVDDLINSIYVWYYKILNICFLFNFFYVILSIILLLLFYYFVLLFV